VSNTAAAKTCLREMFQAIDARDWETLAGFFHPELVYERPGYESLVGAERVLRFYRDERIIADGIHELDGIIIENGAGACWGSMRGTLKDGSDAYVRFADVYAFEGPTLRRRTSYFFEPSV
jgi:ketosteroid isomerase-like protein